MPSSFEKAARPAKRARVTPSAADIRISYDAQPYSEPILTAPPTSTVKKFCSTTPTVVLGFDIETHDWLVDSDKRGRVGESGFYTNIDTGNLGYQRGRKLNGTMTSLDWIQPSMPSLSTSWHGCKS